MYHGKLTLGHFLLFPFIAYYKLIVLFLIFNCWQEPDMASGVNDGKRASLLMMNFSVNEVEFAIDKLGMLNLTR